MPFVVVPDHGFISWSQVFFSPTRTTVLVVLTCSILCSPVVFSLSPSDVGAGAGSATASMLLWYRDSGKKSKMPTRLIPPNMALTQEAHRQPAPETEPALISDMD
jgi:hypothetical protein